MSHDPHEMLDAVRRLEEGLEEIRLRGGSGGVGTAPMEISVTEHTALVEDLELLVDLVGSSWRTTRQEVAAIAAELAELRKVADEARTALRDVRFELRLVQGGSDTPGAA